ncbi:hypothetical protein TEA_030059 [Camellia sinensis var. sinensis]|uniref:DNA-directed RNA polymerase n=1 Tax=Camellia sinensis var. sinensis TaxID=542762 RepID=A0A4S4DCQ0_CAMSN|nr:hypothetical protein TEA_030059 [Camellia sinensis var. sinensis]
MTTSSESGLPQEKNAAEDFGGSSHSIGSSVVVSPNNFSLLVGVEPCLQELSCGADCEPDGNGDAGCWSMQVDRLALVVQPEVVDAADGSCNGLQHYAALGRDALEVVAINLVAGEKPADVTPKLLQGNWKLVKQTVMTSVYGITYVGAREQIKRRLEEKGQITDDGLLFNAACYAAKIIASENQPVRWTTPLGLPVVQPYFKTERHVIRTSLQVLALQRGGDSVEVRKQRTAFPPNFVHSLDGSHMMMTAVACRDAGLRFAGVHDSFWTHACDVDRMNRIGILPLSPLLNSLLAGAFGSTLRLSFDNPNR